MWQGKLNIENTAPISQLHGRKAQQRDNGGCPSSPHTEDIQLSLSLYILGISWAAIPPLEPRGECLGARESVWGPLKRMPGISSHLSSFLKDGILFLWLFSQSGVVGASLPSTGALDYGAWRGAESLCSSGGAYAAEISLLILNCHTWLWGQPISCFQSSFQFQCSFYFVSPVTGVLFS